MKFVFLLQICEIYSNFKFYENPPLVVELFHADRRTNMTTLIAAFRKRLKSNLTVPRSKHTPSQL